MNKQKIALCWALLSPVIAHAQTETVKVFGELDVAAGAVRPVGGQTRKVVDSGFGNQSHWGVRGEEQLGNGLSAVFTLDSFVAVDSGQASPAFWSRESTLGLKLSGAQILLGRNKNPIFDAAVDGNVFGNARLAPLFALVGFASSHVLNAAQDNSVRIDTPIVGGVRGAVLYRLKENSGSKYWSGNLVYQDAATRASLAVDHSDPDVIPGELYSVVGSASHDFGWARLYGTLLGQRDSSSDQKSRGFELGAGIPVHTGTVAISYGVGFKSKLNGDDQQRAVAAAAAYFYPFSKRTRAYVGDQYQKIARSGSGNAIVVGMTHSF